ncbi:hypothetical protein EWM64_g8774 [Hericium alpestre]|uniref:Uncharacterized protein n=1 Tax=Hericium alpestre TaxID=135208 RepID=A0A4Y9ZMC8_9AGAM|nr:hypothetical protein EWM64_g8774 [Hericium alpestre]
MWLIYWDTPAFKEITDQLRQFIRIHVAPGPIGIRLTRTLIAQIAPVTIVLTTIPIPVHFDQIL